MLALVVTGVVVALGWVVIAATPSLRWPGELSLPAGSVDGHRDGRADDRVVALVPARDEAEVLGLSLPSLLAQEGLEGVVLVDDGSTDGTGERALELARSAGAEARSRFERLRIDEHEAGWSGKVAALARGLERARERFGEPDWLLLVDADIRLRPGALGALLAIAHEERRDLVSVMARLRARSFWERLLVPPFVFFFHLLYPFRRVRRDESRVAAAAGGCVLVRSSAVERAGGLEAIRSRLIDDVALAQAVKGSGGRLWLGLDPGVESVRPYDDLASVWRMIARNAFVQLSFSWLLLAGTLAGLALFFVSPPLGLVAALLAGVRSGWGSGAGLAACGFGLAWALQAAALLPSVRHHRVGSVFAWTLPIAAALYGAMTVSSAWSHLLGRTSRWRGREYRRGDSPGGG